MVISGHLLYCSLLFYFFFYTDGDLRTFTLLFYVVLFLVLYWWWTQDIYFTVLRTELPSTFFALESFWLMDHVMLAQQPFCWFFLPNLFHSKCDFAPLHVAWCRFRFDLYANHLSHVWHIYGLSSILWEFTWLK
jgi:hypothetical protein